ncbi:hypothetical protein G6M89_03325 [Natronolimnobius sp. AArcel1]|uniref:hypothetical protein n=1 Tax=Natronolimnobius sp. AArcel1 TaxID=1679093 RepID=UPI0013EBD4D4|nr:hypothetical protein [Natronolimnobius sp. AArcel1]NGM68052.1 hypothetical protein [Natronolimnobius sp. AArcel1]
MPPSLPESLADSWQRAGTKHGESTVLIASINAETTLYEPTEPTALAAYGASAIPLHSLFVVDLSISPPLSAVGIAPEAAFSKAAPKARDQFIDTVESEGIRVEDTRETLAFEAPNDTEGRWYVLETTHPLSDDVQAETNIEADANGHVPAEAHVAVWPTNSSFAVAGGTLPRPDGLESLPDDLAAEQAADPEAARDTISTLIQALDFASDD